MWKSALNKMLWGLLVIFAFRFFSDMFTGTPFNPQWYLTAFLIILVTTLISTEAIILYKRHKH
ncbi:hypothetical protein SAMN04488558_101169 [Ignavigranum ruoffiae]|uniref:Uncharacterized protein n=1 Tax=Ignavigranum ruoffiae TaxID=89093 RepID=A0A1H8Z750_9LACT|nr:hypothetical protein SAMN04488558_101169 [Ignavigranum ruoffiae]